MTISYLMNCGHDDKGWCLECVKELGEENERLRSELDKTHQDHHTICHEAAELTIERDALRDIVDRIKAMVAQA